MTRHFGSSRGGSRGRRGRLIGVTPARPRAYLLLSAAYFPALMLLFVAASWALGKPYDGRAVLGFLVAMAVAGAAVDPRAQA